MSPSRMIVLAALAFSGTAFAAQPKVTGTWSSPSCGSRGYERRITFAADGTFTAEDRVSPCPQGVACVWSGIVNRRGTFEVKGGHVRLKVETPAQPQGEPLPDELDVKKGVIVEGKDCVYKK